MKHKSVLISGASVFAMIVLSTNLHHMILKLKNIDLNISAFFISSLFVAIAYLYVPKISKFSKKARNEFRKWLIVVNIPWVLVNLILPKYWLGLTDGYLYSLQIHESRFGRIFGDWSSAGLAAYPPYLYSSWGVLLKAVPTSLISQGTSFALLYTISITLGYSLTYTTFKAIPKLDNWAGFLSITPIFSLILVHDHWIIEKPHEILGVFLVSAILMRAANKEKTLDFKLGILLGILSGIYTSYALLMIPVIGYLCIAHLKNSRYRRNAWIDTLKFACGSISAALPWLSILFWNKVHFKIIGIPPYFTGADYRGDYLQNSDMTIMWAILAIFALLLVNNKYSSCLNIFGLTALVGVYAGVYLLRLGIVIDSSVNWRNVFSMSMLISIFISLIHSHATFGENFHKSFSFFFPIIYLMSIFSFSAPFALKGTVAFSNARQQNVQSYINEITKFNFKKNSNYLGFGEGMFINFSLPNSLKPVIFFNNSYVAFTNERMEVDSLNSAAKNDSTFQKWLSLNNVCVLIPGIPINGEHKQLVTLNTTSLQRELDSNQINVEVNLPDVRFRNLGSNWIHKELINQTIYIDSKCIMGKIN